MMRLFLAVALAAIIGTRAQSTTNPEGTDPASGYRFRYFVRDDRTGDIKGQSEVRQGDDVRGSYAVADPNGSTRVVTYTAGKDTGFNARVQVHSGTPPLASLPNGESQLPLSHLMKIPPRNIFRTGFQPVQIRVIPPTPTEAPQVTQKPPFSPEEEALLHGQQELPKPGYSEQHLEVFHSPTEANRVDSTTIHGEGTVGTPTEGLGVLSSTTSNDELEPCLPCDNPEENSGRIKQEGDKVQLEMGQVIRTEMKEPVDVSMGKPYQGHPHNSYQNQHARPPTPQMPYQQLRPDVMNPIYMKPLYLRNPSSPNAPHGAQWPPLVSSGNQLYIPHIVVEKEDTPPDVFPSKVYLVPLPRPLGITREDLMSQAYPWDGKTTAPKDEPNAQYKPRPVSRPAFLYPQAFTYLLLPKDTRGK